MTYVRPEGKFIYCTHTPCPKWVANDYWGKVKADGWFFQKDGQAWCPEHIPEWVQSWRAQKTGAKK